MKHLVFVPVVNIDLFNALYKSIKANSQQPTHILIVNNSGKEIIFKPEEVEVHTPAQPLGVNVSWRIGINKALTEGYDIISVFNDDIVLEKNFFAKLYHFVDRFPTVSIFCPDTVSSVEMLKKPRPLNRCYGEVMRGREGWAWTARTSFLANARPIPDELITFFGDDWLFYESARLYRPWIKMNGNTVWHAGSATVGQSNVKHSLNTERKIFRRLI